MPTCPICASAKTVKNGCIHNGKQRFKCNDCGRQFIEQPTKKVIDQANRELIDRLLLERISLAGIARAAQVSEQWLQTLVRKTLSFSKSLENQALLNSGMILRFSRPSKSTKKLRAKS
jgi:transposase-like protein